MSTEEWLIAGCGLLLGLLLGRLWAGYMFWWYLGSKRPDRYGFRTGIYIGDGVYFVVTGEEYGKLYPLVENEHE